MNALNLLKISVIFGLFRFSESFVELSLKNKQHADILVTFDPGTQDLLESLSHVKFGSRSEKLSHVTFELRRHALKSQEAVLNFLHSSVLAQNLKFETLWISNQIFIQNANLGLIEELAKFNEIKDITENEVFQLDYSVEATRKHSETTQWNIEQIQAPKVWKAGHYGAGVVVAHIDSGVRYTHVALRDNYIGEFGWYDPYHDTPLPNDQNGHGTHTMGVIAGSGGIGVAPRSIWMSCKGCYVDLCSSAHLIMCGQFLFCPKQNGGKVLRDVSAPSDCGRVPQVISCSWGGGQNNKAYHPVLDAWRSVGIIPVFSIGNTGPNCNTARSPADSPHVLGVGSTTANSSLALFSGLGPTINGTLKPDLVAPGFEIRSATKSSDEDYSVMKGTSMSVPHVAGTVALLLSYNPDLKFEQIKSALTSGADRDELIGRGITCGGISDSVFPNNAFGYGRVNSWKAFNRVKDLASTSTV